MCSKRKLGAECDACCVLSSCNCHFYWKIRNFSMHGIILYVI